MSENVYTTLEEPTGKESPGTLVAVTVTDPELSVAVGSIQVTLTSVTPSGAVSATSAGQSVMTGASTSGMAKWSSLWTNVRNGQRHKIDITQLTEM